MGAEPTTRRPEVQRPAVDMSAQTIDRKKHESSYRIQNQRSVVLDYIPTCVLRVTDIKVKNYNTVLSVQY